MTQQCKWSYIWIFLRIENLTQHKIGIQKQKVCILERTEIGKGHTQTTDNKLCIITIIIT